MNKKFLYVAVVLLVVLLMGNTNVFADTETDIDTDNGLGVSEQHRNNITKVVQELEKIADKDKKIEEEVKVVAQEEKDVVKDVSEKMDKVEKRGGFKTFLIGSDYKNLGALRSELVTAQNRIDRLTKSLERATSSTTQAELQAQITELENIKTKAEEFIKEQEGKFSLFGWLVRIFQ